MELLGNVLVLTLMAAFVAAIIKILHHAIGSPSIKSDGSIGFESNRILGFYGRWLVINQVELMNREVKRQNKEFKALQDGLKEKERIASGKENRKADYSHANKNLIPDPIEVIWLPLGMCLICFGTWFSLASFVAILPILGFSLGWLPFVAATSTMIAARI